MFERALIPNHFFLFGAMFAVTCLLVITAGYYTYPDIRGLFKKYLDWNCSGCSLGGMCLRPVLTCLYMP